MKITLTAILRDALRTHKLLSRENIKQLARDNGYEESNAERRLRDTGIMTIPVIKLNSKKKPCTNGEHIAWYQWAGGSTEFYKNKKEKK